MEFGLYIRPVQNFDEMVELSKQAESLGLWGVFLNDHFEGLSSDRKEPYLEAWTAITGVGMSTSRIRIGHITLFNSMRNPALLAKMATTLDVMTRGRYETIVGAGWNEPEYLGYDLMGKGRGMPSASERVSRLKESVQILRGMFDNEVFSHEGKYWKLKNAVNVPQPIQKHMRVSVGARQPRMIRIAARYADGMNGSGGMKSIRGYVKTLDHELILAGKEKEDFFMSGFATVTLTKSSEETESILKKMARSDTLDYVRDDSFVGTSDVLIRKLRECDELGMKAMIVIPRATNVKEITDLSERLRDEVFNQL